MIDEHGLEWLTLEEVAERKGKAIGDLTIDMKPRIYFDLYSADELEPSTKSDQQKL